MTPLDTYDEFPKEMLIYLRHYGWNFNQKACDFAVSKIKKEGFTPIEKSKVDTLLQKENINLTNNQLYNYVYVANITKACYYGSSIQNDTQAANYIKDCIENNDSDIHFVQWYASMCHSGHPIPWTEIL